MVGATLTLARASDPHTPFKIINQTKQEIALQPYRVPFLGFQVLEGTPPRDGVLECESSEQKDDQGEHVYVYVILNCENGVKLKLNAVDLEH